MESWDNKKEVIKGSFAEKIVHEFLEKEGYVVYIPTTDKAHCFDRLAIKDRKKLLLVEIKAKAKLNKYPLTGFEYRHYEEYKKISEKHNLPIFIFFVDEMLGEIYGNFLSKLEEGSRRAPWGPQILFKMDAMIRGIHYLSKEEIECLKTNSKRKYEYSE